MRVLLASKELDLLQATKFALECRGLTVLLVVREPDIVKYIAEGDIDILALDAGLSGERTGRIVERIKGDQRLAETVLVLFSRSGSQLQNACPDLGVLHQADDVIAEMFDESVLIDRVSSAAKRLRIERSQYHTHASEWKDPYAVNSTEERRIDNRFKLDAAITIRGKDLLRQPFEEETSMVNLSGGGAYLKSTHHLLENTGLDISFRSPYATNGDLNLRSTVVRAEPGDDRQDPKRRRAAVRFNDDVKQNIEFHLLLARLSGVPGSGPQSVVPAEEGANAQETPS
jgi:DNA-binding response OmpR family regulator